MAFNQSAERIRYDEAEDVQNSTSVIARSNQSYYQSSSFQASNSQQHHSFNKKEEANQSFYHVENQSRQINNASNQNNLISNVSNQNNLIKEVYRKISVSPAAQQINKVSRIEDVRSQEKTRLILENIEDQSDDGDRWSLSQEFEALSDNKRVNIKPIQQVSNNSPHLLVKQNRKDSHLYHEKSIVPTIVIDQYQSPSPSQSTKGVVKSKELLHQSNFQSDNQYSSQSNKQSISQSIGQSTSQSINQQTSQSINQQTSQSINQQTSQSINQSISQSINKSNSQSNFQSASGSSYQSESQSNFQSASLLNYQSANQSNFQSTSLSNYQSANQSNLQSTSLSNYQTTSQSNYQSTSQSAAQSSYQLTNYTNNQLANQSNNQSYQLNSNFNSASGATQNAKYSNFSEKQESQKNIREYKSNESSSSGFRSYQRDELALQAPQKPRRASTNLPLNINIQRNHDMEQGNKFRVLISPTPESDSNMENMVPADDQFNTFPRRRSSVSIVPKSIDEQYSLNEQYKRRASLHPDRVSESRARDQQTREELRRTELSKFKNMYQNDKSGRNQRTENEMRYEEANKWNYEKEDQNKIIERVIPSQSNIQINQERRYEKKKENYEFEEIQSDKKYQEYNYMNKDIRSHINIKTDKFNEQANKEQVQNESFRRHDQQMINYSKEMNSENFQKYSYETESRSQRHQNSQSSQVNYVSNASSISANQTLSHQIASGTSLSAIDYKQNISNQNTGYYKIETDLDGRRFSNPNSILRRSDDSSSQSTISEGIQSHGQKEIRSKSWNGESSSQNQKMQKQLNVSFEQQQVEHQQKKHSMLQHVSEHQDTYRRTNSQTSFDDLYNYENLQHEKKSKRSQRSLSFSGRKVSTRNQILNSNLNNQQYSKNQSAHQDSSSLKILSGSHVGEVSNEFKKVSKLDIKTTSIKNTKSTSSSSQSSIKNNLHKDEQKDYFGSVNVSAKNGVIMLVMDENDSIIDHSKNSERSLLNDSTSSEKNYLKEEEQQLFHRSNHYRRKSDGDALLAQTKVINRNFLNHSYEELHSNAYTHMIPMETVYYTVCTRFFRPENDDWIVNIHRMGTFNASVGSNHSNRCVFWNQLFNQDNEDILVQKLVPPENFQNNDFSINDRTIVEDQSQYLNNRGMNSIRKQSEGDSQSKSSSTKKKRKFSLLKKPRGELEVRNINPMFC